MPGMKWVLGVDEAGRGPLAGPVAVGTVRAPAGMDLLELFPGLNDSKKLTEAARERIFESLRLHPDIRYHVALVSAATIDSKGIVWAVRSGVHRGVRRLMPEAGAGKVWLDGLLQAPEGYEQETVVNGDGTIPAIMLASVAAKVTRDRYMVRLSKRYPQYAFERHKGYGTQQHRDVIAELGLCAIHRTTYCAA